jgi:hypothetical protein
MSAPDKMWCVWSLGQPYDVTGEPQVDNDGLLEFMNSEGQVTACFSAWNAYRLQDKS